MVLWNRAQDNVLVEDCLEVAHEPVALEICDRALDMKLELTESFIQRRMGGGR